MITSILLLLTIVVTSATIPTTWETLIPQNQKKRICKDLVVIDNTFYLPGRQILIKGFPADFSIHWDTGRLFFTHISQDMKMQLEVMSPSGLLDIIKVPGLGQSTAVDNTNGVVYLATDNGVYKYKDGSVEPYAAMGEDVMYIAVANGGDTIYIATWPQNRVMKLTNNGQRMESLSNTIPNGHGITVDTKNNIYFIAGKTYYILRQGTTVPVKIQNLPDDKVTGIYVNKSGNVYTVDAISNIYIIDPDNANATRLGKFNVNNVNTFAMDASNNIFIGTDRVIHKFVAFENNPCSTA